MKTTIIYEKTTRTYHEDNWTGKGEWSAPRAEHAIFTESAALARQIREVLYLPDVEEWNHDGPYDWRVEPSYAEGCMWFTMLTDAKSLVRTVAGAYRSRTPHVTDFYTCKAEEWGGMFDERPTLAYRYNGHVPDIFADFGGELQAELQRGLPNAKQWWDGILTIMEERLPVRSFEFRESGRGHDETHRFSVLTRAPAEELARIYGAELNLTLMEADQMRYEAYAATPEGKAEAKARAEFERDLRTMMGEGGYTSMSRNDDGTISMWRD
jgi:hypothetical protein